MGLLHGHSFIGSTAVIVLALWCGITVWGRRLEPRALRRVATALVHVLVLQVALGIASFVVVPKEPGEAGDAITALEVTLTTAHQATGALLLATAGLLLVWLRRR